MAEKYLGFVTDKIPSSGELKGANAIIKVVAIKEDGFYRKLTYEEAKRFCPPNGLVFGPKFFISTNSDFYEGPFIEFETQLGKEKENKSFNETDYIVNYTNRPKVINLPRLVIYNGKLNKIITNGYLSPNEVNSTVDKNNLFGGKDVKFFLYDSFEQKAIGVFKYQSTSDTIESNYGKDVQEFKIPSELVLFDNEGRLYLLFNEQKNVFERGSIIDFMTNQQLADWLKIKMNNISLIDKNTISLITDMAESQSAEDDREISRFERIKAKIEAYEINIQTLVDLICKHPKYFKQFTDNIEFIEKEVKDYFEKKYIIEAPSIIKANQEKIKVLEDEILKLDGTLESKKEKITSEVEKFRTGLEKSNETISKQIEEKRVQLKILNENYDSVIGTISAIAPVLNTSKASEEYISELCKVEFPKYKDARSYSKIKEENDESFVSFMKRHACYSGDRFTDYLKQVKKVFSHRACFIPNAGLAYLFAKALRNTEVMVMHVEHDWLHYSDFVNHGLLEAFNEAVETPDKNFILLLDGINVTQPECGLRPLLNLINGNMPILEGTGIGFPNNMTVMATVISSTEVHSVGLKLTPSFFCKWFAIGNPSEESDKIVLPENFWDDEVMDDVGYVEPSDLPKETVSEKAELLDKYFEF